MEKTEKEKCIRYLSTQHEPNYANIVFNLCTEQEKVGRKESQKPKVYLLLLCFLDLLTFYFILLFL